jgi:7-keto-8-aminopelargonate synthetase-like enzyme
MEAAGFTVSGADHPICPVMLGDARLSSQMADDMLKKGKRIGGRVVLREKNTCKL